MSGRILQVVTDTEYRGAQVFATELQVEFERRGHDVRTVALVPGSHVGLPIAALGKRRLGARTLARLRREVRGSSIVIAHGSTTLPACALTTWGTGVPFVYRQISDSKFWAPRGPRRLRTAFSLRWASRVVALWSGAARTLHEHLRVPTSRIRVIPNGVQASRFEPATNDERLAARQAFRLDEALPVVTFLGALVPEKGVDVAIDAVAALSSVQLLVAGDGPERPRLQAQAAQVAADRVVFAGPLSDARSAYAATDLIVLPTRGGDSMPAVLIEAGLMGLPSVATPIGAIPEVIIPSLTGELVPVDNPVELARAIDAIVTTPARRTELGRAARTRNLEHFSIERVADMWHEAIAELL